MSTHHRIAGYPGELPRFPICSGGREGCSLIGFHGHLSRQTAEERERIEKWHAWFDAQIGAGR